MGSKKNKKKLSSLKIRRIKKKARLSDEGRKTTECGLTSTSNGEVVTMPENSQLSDEARLSTGCEFINSTNTAVITLPENSESTKQSDSDNLIIEAEKLDDNQFQLVTGRRIVDINYIFRELQDKGRHNNLFNCNSSNFILVGEKRNGLISQFKFECAMCKEICIISNEKKEDADQLNLNLAAITGVIGIGIGYSQFEELFSAINIPVFSSKYYTKLQNEVYAKWEDTAVASMEAAAQKEKDFALAEGRTKSGYPVIDVYVDAAWCARSYGSNYKASSGVAAIIGRKTGQILYVGVKNKYCIICARAKNKNLVPKEHLCFKNFQGSSCSMEAEILVEGFKSSISMYGLLYGRMIGDGDASTYAKILNADPYKEQNVTVEKIECKNHVLRNFCKKLRGICSETKYKLIHRKTLTNVKIMTMRKAIVKSIKYHNTSENPKNVAIGVLHNDIINSVSHAYGNHQMCESYYCQKEKNDGDGLKNIQSSTFLFRINAIVSNVAAKARSLIEDVDTNKVECFNSVIAKFVGGKRINFSSKRGYQGRSSAAVVSFNTKCPISSVQESFLNKAPGGKVAEVERRRTLKRKFNSEHPVKKQRRLHEANQKQHDYGHGTTAPDMPPEELETAKKEYLKQLKSLTADRHAIERSTVLQRESSDWLEIRKKIITASNFGPICRRKETLDTAPLVKNILFKKNLADIASVAHGIENEKQALQKLEQQENITISACGLFIDQNYSFIGASPDGLVGNDTVVEVKCPIVAAKLGLSQAIEQNKIKMLKYCKKDKTVTINKTSDWYFQVQGQLHITNRKKCIFGIWESENEPMYIIQIEKDDNLWNKMESRIVKFYTKCLLPEIIDSRRARGMPIRNICLKDDEDDNDKENVSTIDSQPNSKQMLSDDDHNVQPVQGDQNVQPVLQTRQLNFEEL